MSSPSPRLRLGILRDYPEELWPSMDLCAEMLTTSLSRDFADRLSVVELCPPFRSRFQRVPGLGAKHAKRAFNADRLINRFWDYPRSAAKRRGDADVFHVVDHSYSQVIAKLPAGRVGVYCHDLDTFRCILTPSADPRPLLFRRMAKRILDGFQRAAVVFYSNATVCDEIVKFGLIDSAKLVHAPLGFADEYCLNPPVDDRFRAVMLEVGVRPFVLHVGSCIPRKRIDVLLNAFARLGEAMPELRLVKVGGEWTGEQQKLIDDLNIRQRLLHVTHADRKTLASLYHAAALVMLPSEVEGFGLPLLEALACGARVVASDLPVFQGIAGPAARYAGVGKIDEFVASAIDWMTSIDAAPQRAIRAARVAGYSWKCHAQIIAESYLRLQ